MTALAPDAPFVGRQRELDALHTRLTACLGGEGAVTLLAGEPGIGKTRILAEFAAAARERGLLTLRGACYEGDTPPYGPWAEVLRDFVRQRPAGAPSVAAGAGTDWLLRLVPELRPHIHKAAGDELGDRVHISEAVGSLLVDVARERPVLVLLDDLHWADADSLALLRPVARLTRSAPLLIAGAFRDTDLTLEHPLITLLDHLRREAPTLRLRLHGLSDAESQEYIDRAAPGALPSEVARSLREGSGGNPLYLCEMVNHAVSGGGAPSVPAWTEGTDLPRAGVPDAVREALAGRIARLSSQALTALRTASAFTAGVRFRVLAAVTGVDEDDLLEVIDEATAAGLLRVISEREEVYGFPHAIVRASIYATLNPSRRARLHWRIGETLARLYERSPDPYLTEITHHMALGASAGDAAVAATYALRAGDRARAVLAYADAVRLYELGMSALDAAEHAPPLLRAELQMMLGEAHNRLGNDEQARIALREAAGIARRQLAEGEREAADVLARAAINYGGLGEHVGFTDDTMIELLDAALAVLPPEDSVARSVAMARLARARFWAGEDPEAALAMGEESVRMALRLAERNDDGALYVVATAAPRMPYAPGDPTERMLAEELPRLAEASGDPRKVLQALRWRISYQLGAGDRAGLETTLARYTRLASEYEILSYQWSAAVFSGMVALLEGNLAEAERRIISARELGVRAARTDVEDVFAQQLIVLRREQGRLHELTGVAQFLVDRYPALYGYRTALGFIHSESGDLETARGHFDALMAGGLGPIQREPYPNVTLVLLAELCVALEDRERAPLLIEAIAPYSGRIFTLALATSCLGAADHHLARLTALLGDPEAEQLFARAYNQHRRLDAVTWTARTELAWGEWLAGKGPAEAARTRALLESARARATAVEMPLIAARAGAALAALAAPPARTVRPTYPDGLTEREVEVLRLVAGGQTNKEIAETLVLSIGTVERHITNLYAKIGARGRAEATAYALRHKLAEPPSA